jgi:hypothetical protein
MSTQRLRAIPLMIMLHYAKLLKDFRTVMCDAECSPPAFVNNPHWLFEVLVLWAAKALLRSDSCRSDSPA